MGERELVAEEEYGGGWMHGSELAAWVKREKDRGRRRRRKRRGGEKEVMMSPAYFGKVSCVGYMDCRWEDA